MKRPPWGAGKKQGLPLFLSILSPSSLYLFVSLFFWSPPFFNQSAEAETDTTWSLCRMKQRGRATGASLWWMSLWDCFSNITSLFLFHYSCRPIFQQVAWGVQLPSSPPHRRQPPSAPSVCSFNRELFSTENYLWQTFRVSFPRKHLKQITNSMLHLPNKRREKKGGGDLAH